MKPAPTLIGLHGKPRVGKDTVASYLIRKYNLLRYGPSVPLKDTCAAMFDVPREYFDDDNMKDTVDPFWGITYRQMAQKVGKESSRDVFGDDIWLRHVEKKWKKIQEIKQHIESGGHHYVAHFPDRDWSHYNGIILADVRYENEVHWIKEHGGVVFFILRDDAPQSSDTGHVVDRGLPLALADITIYNNGTIDELYAQVENEMAFYFGWE